MSKVNKMKSLMTQKNKWTNQAGFTLMELIVASFISILVLGLVAQIFTSQRKTFGNQTNMAKMVANGRGAVEFISRAIQNAGYHVIRGGKILAASDHYVTTVADRDDNGAVEGDEILTYVVSSVSGTNNRSITFDAFFDMNNDGKLLSGETNTFTIDYSMAGPPFNLMQYTLKSDGTVEGYVVAENIDNLVFRFYDHSGNEMGVNAVDGTAAPITGGIKNLPLVIPAADISDIRTVNMEFIVRTKEEDLNNNYTNTGSYISSSAATQSGGTPVVATGGYNDSFRRRVMTAQASPRNLGLAPFGRLTLQPTVNPITCPATSTGFTLTAVNSAGTPIDNWNVNLRVTDSTTVTLSSGTMTTDSQGEASGSISYDWSTPSLTTTLSADAQWTDMDGVLRSVITSVPVSFISPSGAGVFDNFDDGDALGWAPTDPAQWEVDNQEYKLVDGPSGTVGVLNPQITPTTALAPDTTATLAYAVPASAGGNVKLVVGVGAESAGSSGDPGVLNPQAWNNGGGSSNSYTTPTYTVPNPTTSGNPLKLIVVASTEDGSSNIRANSASFGGVSMIPVGDAQTSSGTKAGVAMFYLDVTPGQSSGIAIGWPSTVDYQVVTVVTLENVQPGDPEVPGAGFINNSGGMTNGSVTTVSDKTLLVLGGSSGHNSTISASGAGHVIRDQDTDGGTMRGMIGTALVPTAGNVTNLGWSSSTYRMSVVIAGFAPSGASSTIPDSVQFGSTTKTSSIQSQEMDNGSGSKTGASLWEFDVNAGDTGTITVTWGGDVAERMITAVTLTDVDGGAPGAGLKGGAGAENNDPTSVTLGAQSDAGSMAVSFGFQNHTADVAEGGSGHTLQISGQAHTSGATWGGISTVEVPTDTTLTGYSYTGNHTRRAMVMASFLPAPVTIVDELTTTGCQPWEDVEVLVKMKNKGNVSAPRHAGIIVRYTDADNYYYAKVEHDGSANDEQYIIKLIRRAGGVETVVASTPAHPDSNAVKFKPSTPGNPKDHYLKIRVEGEDFKVRWWQPVDMDNPMDDEPATWKIEVTDSGTSVTEGTVGLMTDRAEFQFDNVNAGPPV